MREKEIFRKVYIFHKIIYHPPVQQEGIPERLGIKDKEGRWLQIAYNGEYGIFNLISQKALTNRLFFNKIRPLAE